METLTRAESFCLFGYRTGMESGRAASLEVRIVHAADRAAAAQACGMDEYVSATGQVEYLEAREGEQAVGYLALARSAGGSVWFHGPVSTKRGTAPAAKIARALIKRANQRCRLKNNSLAQVMLGLTQSQEASYYAEFGFDTQIVLELLTRPLTGNRPGVPVPESPDSHANLDSVCYTPQHHGRFARVLAEADVDSVDCLAMHRKSDPEMALADFRDVPDFDPTLWRLFQSDSEDFGCLLMNHHPVEASLEIAYLGLKSAFRGRGWGHQAMAIAHSSAKQLNCQRMTVGVDIRNTPARRLYARWGFWCFSGQQVLIRTTNARI